MTQPQFARLCRIWQRRLRLADWQITAELAPGDVPEHRHLGATDFGSTQINAPELSADVIVRDTEYMEVTLIHELLHLRLLPFDGEDHEAQETAINLLADCYLRAYPRRRKQDGV